MTRMVAKSTRCLAAALMLLAALAFGLHEIGGAEAAQLDMLRSGVPAAAHSGSPPDHSQPDRPPDKALLASTICTLQAVCPSGPPLPAMIAPSPSIRPEAASEPFHAGLDPAALLRPPCRMTVA